MVNAIADEGQNFSVLNDGLLSRMASTRDPGEIQFSLAPEFVGRKDNEKYITDISLEYGITSRVEIGFKFLFMGEDGGIGPYGNGAYALYNFISKPHWDFLVTGGVEFSSLSETIDGRDEEHTFFRPQIQMQKLWRDYFANLEVLYERKRIRQGLSLNDSGLVSTLTAGVFQNSGRLFLEIQNRALKIERGLVLGFGKSWIFNDSFRFALGGAYGTTSSLPRFRVSALLSWDIDLFKDKVTQLRY